MQSVMAGVLPPLSQVLQPIDLDPLLVAEDGDYVDRLAGQRNLTPKLRTDITARYA
jgi:hypothetical protein